MSFWGAVLLAQAIAVTAVGETAPVASRADAADDPAIWVHPTEPANSLILATDKTFGLRVYDLAGVERQALAIGRLNNVDVLAGVTLADWRGDLAIASNRSDDSIALFAVAADGVQQIGAFSVAPEPYGVCLGRDGDAVTVFVAHKQGYVQPFVLTALSEPPRAVPPVFFESQIEGCVFDAAHRRLLVGEEARGLWAVDFADGLFRAETLSLVDAVGGPFGLVADVEGVTLYEQADGAGVVIVSAQGADRFIAYDRRSLEPLGQFEIVAGAGVDGAQETDGLAAIAAPLGPQFPFGALIVQDGFNVAPDGGPDGRTADEVPLAPQNFKIIDWRSIAAALPPTAAN